MLDQAFSIELFVITPGNQDNMQLALELEAQLVK